MKISEILKTELINTDLKSTTKEEVVNELCDMIASYWNIDKEKFLSKILEREDIESTGIGRGVAIPHARTDVVKGIVMSFGISRSGIDYSSLDGNPVHLFFMIGSSSDSSGIYIKLLSNLSKLLRKDSFRENLLEAKTPEEIIKIIKQYEKEL